jgi:hypothetical protein
MEPSATSRPFGRPDHIVNWNTDSSKRILGTCQNPAIDPVNAARFMTAANTS